MHVVPWITQTATNCQRLLIAPFLHFYCSLRLRKEAVHVWESVEVWRSLKLQSDKLEWRNTRGLLGSSKIERSTKEMFVQNTDKLYSPHHGTLCCSAYVQYIYTFTNKYPSISKNRKCKILWRCDLPYQYMHWMTQVESGRGDNYIKRCSSAVSSD